MPEELSIDLSREEGKLMLAFMLLVSRWKISRHWGKIAGPSHF
jgi:hypothetical protein